jgi:HEAT repeat protein
MTRILILSALMALFATTTPGLVRAAEEEDPIQSGRKASEWLEMMQKLRTQKGETKEEQAKIVARRRLILDNILEVLGPKVRIVLVGVHKTLKDDPDESLRAAAATWLGRNALRAKDGNVDARDTIEVLTTALKSDKASGVREASATALGALAKVHLDVKTAVPVLAAALRDEGTATRVAAAESLGRIGPDARDAQGELLAALQDKKADRFVRRYAAFALVHIGASDEQVVKALADALADPTAPRDVREDMAKALGQLGKDASTAVPVLAEALSDKDSDVKRAAAVALEQIGPESRAALPALKKALKDDDKTVRAQVIHTLGTLGKDAAEAVPALLECLQDRVVEIRLAAIRALGNMGSEAKAAVPALQGLTQDAKTDIREAAEEALKKIQEG